MNEFNNGLKRRMAVGQEHLLAYVEAALDAQKLPIMERNARLVDFQRGECILVEPIGENGSEWVMAALERSRDSDDLYRVYIFPDEVRTFMPMGNDERDDDF